MSKKRNFRSNFLKDMGLAVHKDTGWPMAYGMNHGYLMWAPAWLKGAICTVWNHVNCALYGHDQIGVDAFKQHVWHGAPRCCHCSAKLMVDGKYPTPEEVLENDRICQEEWDSYNQEEPPAKSQ